MINKPHKDTKKPAPEEVPKPTYLSQLFKPSPDIAEAEAERDSNFGYVPKNTTPKGSFTK